MILQRISKYAGGMATVQHEKYYSGIYAKTKEEKLA
jgi:hypothetical protein